MIKRLAIIPARGGSKRIKNKNLRKFHGKPLIYYSITAAKNSKIFDKIHVSSDSKKILKYSEKLKIKTDFKRPKILANDKVGIRDVLKYVVKKYKNNQIHFDEVWLIYATNPFVNKKTILNCLSAYKKISKKKNNALMTVTKYNYPINWAQILSSKKILKPIQLKNIKTRSQQLSNFFCDAGMINIYNKKNFTEKMKVNYFPFYIPLYSSVDIDNHQDFELAKRLFKKK